MLSCSVSLVSFICLVVVLHYFDGHVVTDIPLSLSINTLVAIFAAISKSALMFSVAECGCVGQPGGPVH